VCAGIDDVDDVESADGFLRYDLRGIYGGRRFVDIDDLVDLLLVRDGHINGRAGRDLNAGLNQSIETFFFNAESVFAGGEGRKLAASGEIGLAANGGRRRRLQGNASGRNDDAIFVGDDDGGSEIRLRDGGRNESEGEQQSTHAVTGILRWDAVGPELVLRGAFRGEAVTVVFFSMRGAEGFLQDG